MLRASAPPTSNASASGPVADSQAQQVLDAIEKSAKTGRIGDGKIFVTPVEEAVRIRTGERAEEAI
jgi:nitrogen regulatory protein P-II 1